MGGALGWDDVARDFDVPDVRTIWDRLHVARKAGKVCGVCKDPIEPGQKYQTTGMTCDGEFQVWNRHQFGERYPSGCPKFAPRDQAEMRAGDAYP